jgi:hypothetical protein
MRSITGYETSDYYPDEPVLYPCRQAGSRPVTGYLLFGAGDEP